MLKDKYISQLVLAYSARYYNWHPVKRRLKSLHLQCEQRKRYWKTDNVVEVQRHLRNEFGTPPRTWVNITQLMWYV